MLKDGELSADEASIIRKTLLSLEGLRLQPGDAVQVLESAGNRLYDLLGAGFETDGVPFPGSGGGVARGNRSRAVDWTMLNIGRGRILQGARVEFTSRGHMY